MTPEELHAYVVTCWMDHRVAAQAATAGPWDYSFSSLHMNGSGTVRIAPAQGGPAITIGHFLNGADPIHITINNPAHVIAVCDAALRRLARHGPQANPLDGCLTCAYDEWSTCPEVLDDAAPFINRPDFPNQLIRGERA